MSEKEASKISSSPASVASSTGVLKSLAKYNERESADNISLDTELK